MGTPHDDMRVTDVCRVQIVNKKDKQRPVDFECQRCGRCCRSYSFWLGVPFNEDIARLMLLHNCTPMKRTEGQKGLKNEMGIRIPNKCIYLGQQIDGKAVCEIHEGKPKVCKEYYCREVKDKAVQELVDGVHL